MPTVMMSCGEASGDLYAGALALELQRLAPGVRIVGVGGEKMHEAGAELVADYRGLSVTGIVEVLSILPRSLRVLKQMRERMVRDRPDVIVLIDFPDFNFRLAAAAHELGIPIVYYVGPQIWAWRPGRIKVIKQLVAKVLVIFPFEQQLYEQAGVPVEFVGHPLPALIHVTESRDRVLAGAGLDPAAPTIALLPGSRPNEVRAILPILVEAASLIRGRVPNAQFVIARAPKLSDQMFEAFSRVTAPSAMIAGRADDVLNASDVVITASGTATVQAALHGKPMVIVYRLAPLTYKVGRPFVKVDTFGMVNLLAGRRVVPELIQDDFTPARVADETVALLTDPAKAAEMRRALGDVRGALGESGATRRAAEAVLAVATAHAPA
jgi:lipid-A-disaccharide synthase